MENRQTLGMGVKTGARFSPWSAFKSALKVAQIHLCPFTGRCFTHSSSFTGSFCRKKACFVHSHIHYCHSKNPGYHDGPKILETCFKVLETSFQAEICTDFPKTFTNFPKICTNFPKWSLTCREYFRRMMLRDFWTIFRFLAHPPHPGFTVILKVWTPRRQMDPISSFDEWGGLRRFPPLVE